MLENLINLYNQKYISTPYLLFQLIIKTVKEGGYCQYEQVFDFIPPTSALFHFTFSVGYYGRGGNGAGWGSKNSRQEFPWFFLHLVGPSLKLSQKVKLEFC